VTMPNLSPDPSGQAVGAVGKSPGRPFTIAAFILALLSLAMMPPAGIVGVVCGAIGWSRGDRNWGIAAIVASVIGFIGGFVIAAFVLTEVVKA
jgi:hypothetical protein